MNTTHLHNDMIAFGGAEATLDALVNRESAARNGEADLWDYAYGVAFDTHRAECWPVIDRLYA